jgi:hypothetical protein
MRKWDLTAHVASNLHPALKSFALLGATVEADEEALDSSRSLLNKQAAATECMRQLGGERTRAGAGLLYCAGGDAERHR